MTQSDRSDSVRQLGDFRLEIQRRFQPAGWAWVRVNDAGGQQLFAGVVPEDELALDVIQGIERYRAYDEARRAEQ